MVDILEFVVDKDEFTTEQIVSHFQKFRSLEV